jgi:hypothetical protein
MHNSTDGEDSLVYHPHLEHFASRFHFLVRLCQSFKFDHIMVLVLLGNDQLARAIKYSDRR